MNDIQKRLKRVREKYNLTQADAYNLLKMPRRTYENWENGSRKPSDWLFDIVIDTLEIRAKERNEEKKMTNDRRKEVAGQVRYIVSQERPGGDTWDEVFETLEEANSFAENEFNRMSENDRKKNNLVVYEVKGEDLNDDAFDGTFDEPDEIVWTCYNGADTPGFKHYCVDYK